MTQIFFVIYEYAVLVVSIFTIAFAIYAFRKHQTVGAIIYGVWMVVTSGWLISHLYLFFIETDAIIIIGLRIELLFQSLVPVAILIFALQYTERNRWLRTWGKYLIIIPALTVVMSWTPLYDNLIWVNLVPQTSNIWVPILYTPGPVYWLFGMYVNFCLIISAWLYLQYTKFCSTAVRNHCLTLIGLMIVFLFTYSLNIAVPGHPFTYNFISFAVSISGLIIGFAIFRYRLFDLSPVRYHELLENVKDGIVVIGTGSKLMQINQKAATLLGLDPNHVVGKKLVDVLPEKSPWLEIINDEIDQPLEIMQNINQEVHYYEITCTSTNDQEKKNEQLIFIQDITKTKVTEIAEKTSREMAEVRAMELDVLRKVAERLNQSVEISDVTQSGLEQIIKSVGARFGYVVLSNGNGRPHLMGSCQLPPILKDAFESYPYCPSCKSFERFMAGDYQEPVAFVPCPILDEVSMSYPGLISIPLHLGQRQLGVLYLIMAPQAVFSGDEINLLQTIGDQYSAAIERAGLFENAELLATIDALTGLFNRRHFFHLAQTEFDRTRRYSRPVSIVMLDIDFFKYVNDTFGHLIGDYVLQQIADRCKSVLRSSDVIGRYGGEEFVILLPETNLDLASRIADRMRRLVMDRPVITERGEVSLTVSLGIACMESGSNASLEQVLDYADQALYLAKGLGRNRIHAWPDASNKPSLLDFNET